MTERKLSGSAATAAVEALISSPMLLTLRPVVVGGRRRSDLVGEGKTIRVKLLHSASPPPGAASSANRCAAAAMSTGAPVNNRSRHR